MDTQRGKETKGGMDVDPKSPIGELKIRGQAERAGSDSVREHSCSDIHVVDADKDYVWTRTQVDQAELERRESELKERALRNKVVRTRKSSVNVLAAASGSGGAEDAGN